MLKSEERGTEKKEREQHLSEFVRQLFVQLTMPLSSKKEQLSKNGAKEKNKKPQNEMKSEK